LKTSIKKLQFAVVICLILFSALYVWSISAARQKQVKLPKVVSEAKNIEVVNVKVEEPHTLIVTLRNNSEKPVVALTLETGNANDGDGVSAAGYKEGDEPDAVIVNPHETYDMDMPLSYLRPDGLVRVSGVFYADDTEEGNKNTLEVMRDQKKQIKDRRLKKERKDS
jgi:hypothetical protein